MNTSGTIPAREELSVKKNDSRRFWCKLVKVKAVRSTASHLCFSELEQYVCHFLRHHGSRLKGGRARLSL